jgi:hypothetical protein
MYFHIMMYTTDGVRRGNSQRARKIKPARRETCVLRSATTRAMPMLKKTSVRATYLMVATRLSCVMGFCTILT